MSKYGYNAEEIVANHLKGYGGNCKVDSTQPGRIDILCFWETVWDWRIQVKATKANDWPDWPSNQNVGNLKATARLNNQVPIIALVDAKQNIKFQNARDGRKMPPTDEREFNK